LFGRLLLSNLGEAPLYVHGQVDLGGVSQAICFFPVCKALAGQVGSKILPWSLGYEWALYLFAPAITN
jgi:hypothetical protein